MENQKIGTFIAALRREQRMTQEQLAEKLGVSNRSVSRWENGNTLPDLSLLQALSAVLGVNMAELLSGQRLPENIQRAECVRLAFALAEREKESLRKTLNLRFGVGLILLICAVLFHRLTDAPTVFYWLCTGLGTANLAAGFWEINRNNFIIPSAVLTALGTELHIKTATEMLPFSMMHQSGHKKQHRRAFEALENMLQPDEYAVFTFIGNSCTVNDRPGLWHISAALTNRRLLLAGENIRGYLLTTTETIAYDRKVFRSLRTHGSSLVICIGTDTLVVEGNGMPSICDNMKVIFGAR